MMASDGPKKGKKSELQQKSPAEFFAGRQCCKLLHSHRSQNPDLSSEPCLAPKRSPLHTVARQTTRTSPDSTMWVSLGVSQGPHEVCMACAACTAFTCAHELASYCLPDPQPGKCLYTTIRELVENALDSAESISNLPVIDITMLVLL